MTSSFGEMLNMLVCNPGICLVFSYEEKSCNLLIRAARELGDGYRSGRSSIGPVDVSVSGCHADELAYIRGCEAIKRYLAIENHNEDAHEIIQDAIHSSI